MAEAKRKLAAILAADVAGYSRLMGDDADRLSLDPAMRWIVGGKAVERQAASSSQMGRFETEVLATEENLGALADLSGQWIDQVHDRHPPTKIILDMDSSVSPTHGDQEGTAYNGVWRPAARLANVPPCLSSCAISPATRRKN